MIKTNQVIKNKSITFLKKLSIIIIVSTAINITKNMQINIVIIY